MTNPPHRPSPADLDRALSRIDASLEPLDQTECLQMLAELRVCTIPRKETSSDMELSVKVYRLKLLAFPADVVRHVLRQWPDASDFWPTWHELLSRLQPLVQKREMVRFAIQQAKLAPPLPE